MSWLQDLYEKGLWKSIKDMLGNSPEVADYGWIPSEPEENASASQGSEESVRDAFTEGVTATPGSLGYGNDSTTESDYLTPGVADYSGVPPGEDANSSQGSEEAVRDAFTEGAMATPGSLGYGGDINVPEVIKAAWRGLLHGGGRAVSTMNEAIKTMGKPQYMTDDEWNAKQTPFIKGVDRFGEQVQEASPLAEYEPYSPEWYAQTIAAEAPTALALGTAALAGLRSGNPAALRHSGESGAMRLFGRAIGAAKNNADTAKFIENLSGISPEINKIAANAPAVLSRYGGNVLANTYLQAPAIALEAQMEGNDAYKDAIKAGLSHAEAERVREDVVRPNMSLLAGTNALETATAFMDLPYKGPMHIFKNVLGEAARYGANAVQNAGEEFGQENIKRTILREALAKEVNRTDATTPEGMDYQQKLLKALNDLPEPQWDLQQADDGLKEQAAGGLGAGLFFSMPGTAARSKRGDFSKRAPSFADSGQHTTRAEMNEPVADQQEAPPPKADFTVNVEETRGADGEKETTGQAGADLAGSEVASQSLPQDTGLPIVAEGQQKVGENSTQQSAAQADAQAVPLEEAARKESPISLNENAQAAKEAEVKQQVVAGAQNGESLQEGAERVSAKEQAVAGRLSEGESSTANEQAVAEIAVKQTQQAEPLTAPQQESLRKSLASAVQNGDYATAVDIAGQLGMMERVKRYSNLIPLSGGKRPPTIALRQAANAGNIAVTERYPTPSGRGERSPEASATYPVGQYQDRLGGQTRPGVRSKFNGPKDAVGVQAAEQVVNSTARSMAPRQPVGYTGREREETGPKAIVREEGAKYDGREVLIANNPLYKGDVAGRTVAERAIQDTLQFAEGLVATPPNRSRQYPTGGTVSGPTRQEIGAADSVQGRKRDWATNRRERREGKTIGLGVTRELIRGDAVSLVGKKVRGSDELAIHAQVVRHPGYETLHIVYVKENTVVHHEAYSSRLPDQVSFLSPGETLESFGRHLDETVKRVGADGYYLVHNHPSGHPKPSQEDIELTEYFAKRRTPQEAAKGLQGHVVINSNRYAVIDREGRVTEHELRLTEGDKLLTPESKHAALGVQIKDAGTLASIAKNEQLSDKQSVVYYLTAENEVRGVQVVPNEILANAKVAARYLRWSARAHYAKIPAIVTSDRTVYEGMQELAKKGYVLDVVPVEYGRGIEGRLAEGRGEIGSGAVGRGEASGSEGPGKAKGANNPIVKEAAARGRKRHKEYDYGPGVEKEKVLPSGKRMDGYDAENKVVHELKPNNPKAVRKGLKQLDEYVEEANEVYGRGHIGKLHAYDK
ncbi:JAB domain-containing protein [Anaerospora hongkongensis]|uniref:JAB domain-containing protein n=1 Tax=Anaerospora hongkongensis TaxID=244830 RepID=UPI00289ACB3E|nr:JAB domain-containing protein [Anaerospora hongkongensis]